MKHTVPTQTSAVDCDATGGKIDLTEIDRGLARSVAELREIKALQDEIADLLAAGTVDTAALKAAITKLRAVEAVALVSIERLDVALTHLEDAKVPD